MSDLAVHGFFMLFAISFLMGLATVFTWVERKQSAITSDRIGANRCYVRIPFTNIKFVAWGLFHGVADGGKLLLKENFTPRTYDRFCYNLAPWLAGVPVLLVFAVIPFGGALIVGERSYVMQIAPLDAGVLFVLAISGIGVLSTMLAGWSSNNKFSLMGAARGCLADDLVRSGHGAGAHQHGSHVRHARSECDGAVAIASAGRRRARLGHLRPAHGVHPVHHRGHRRKQAHPVRSARVRVRARGRLLHRIHRDEDGHVHAERVHRDRGDLGARS